jgi:hypothetical protein
METNAVDALTQTHPGIEWPLGQMTDTELSRKLAELKQALTRAAETPGGSREWRETELQIAEVMAEQADRLRIRRMPLGSGLTASELYAYSDHPGGPSLPGTRDGC